MDNGIFRSSGIKAKTERFQQHDDSINVTRRLAIDNFSNDRKRNKML